MKTPNCASNKGIAIAEDAFFHNHDFVTTNTTSSAIEDKSLKYLNCNKIKMWQTAIFILAVASSTTNFSNIPFETIAYDITSKLSDKGFIQENG